MLTPWSLPSDVSRNSEISLQCYLRSGDRPSTSGAQGGGAAKDGQGDDVMGVGDLYLGGVKFVPDFGNQVSRDCHEEAWNGRLIQILLHFSEPLTSGIPSVEVLVRSMFKSLTKAIM
jgi:hypothetical protein